MTENTYIHMSNIMKAALPHLDNDSLETVYLFTSFLEFMGSFYNFKNPSSLKTLEIQESKLDIEALLSSIKPVCYDNERKLIDNMLNAYKTMKVFNMYNDIMEATNNSNDNSTSNFDILKSFLPEDQVETFENMSMLFTAMSYDNNNNN